MLFPRSDFPLLSGHSHLSYLDSAATTQKPHVVLDALNTFYTENNAQVYRGIYSLAERATEQYEAARDAVAQYCGASSKELIFTYGTTSGINLIASSWASGLQEGDEIIISELEHHANLLPWVRLEQEKGIVLKYIPLRKEGILNYATYKTMLSSKTKLVSVLHTSNVLGTRVDLPLIISEAKKYGAAVLVDATQASGRERLQVRTLGADFVTFSGHKMLGPTGIGALYIAKERLKDVAPYQLGGGMVKSVDFHSYQPAEPPLVFEAGTPPIAQAIGFKAAVDYLSAVSFEELKQHEAALCSQIIEGLEKLPSFTILGPIEQLKQSGHMVSFVSSKAHAHDIAAFVDQRSICVRAGNHCAQPLHKVLGVDASVRASFYGYTTHDDIDKLISSLNEFEKKF